MTRKKSVIAKSSNEILWAPWRHAYFVQMPKAKKQGCLFCRLAHGKDNDRKNLVVARTPFSFAVLNRYPYNTGHVMIVPNRHVGEFGMLSDAEALDMIRLHDELFANLKKALKPAGFNMGVNFGRVGGAGIIGHIHIHLVPRWVGDNNFMPTISNTKVISESLSSLHDRLVQFGKKRKRSK